MQEWWLQQQKIAEQLAFTATKRSTFYAIVRFLLFLFIAWSFFKWTDGYSFYGLSLLVSLIFFCWVMTLHKKQQDCVFTNKTKIEVIQQVLSRFDGQWKNLPNYGAQYCKEDQPWLEDLDLFGQHSLYQYCNMTTLPQGHDALANLLQCPQNFDELALRQETIQELSQNKEFLLADWTASHRIKKNMAEAFTNEKIEQLITPIKIPIPAWFIRFLPVVTITMLVLTILHLVPPICFLILFLVQSALALFSLAWIREKLQAVTKSRYSTESCMNRIQLIRQSDFQSELLQQLKQQIEGKSGLIKATHQLDHILSFLSIQANPFLYLPAQLLFCWDLQCTLQWNHWIELFGSHWKSVLQSLSKLESWESLTMPALTHSVTCFGKAVKSDQPVLLATQLTHPFLKEENAVANDFTLDHPITLITGSNMSGKTTFMRTLGVNQVLFQAGAPCCAQQYQANLVQICTSMRVRDDVNHGISTFYGELLRIRQIMDASKQKTPLLVLIDEIFKGTNSIDRIEGSRQVIRHLDKPWISAFVTTHDFELCDLEKQHNLINYHFEENYQDNQILFDYKLKKGRCTTRNAKALMRLIGIIE